MYFNVCLAESNISMRNKLVQAVELAWVIVIVRSELYERIGDSRYHRRLLCQTRNELLLLLYYVT